MFERDHRGTPKRHKKFDAAGRIHVDVLKVQHHGATANVDDAFVRAVTADHYVFCGTARTRIRSRRSWKRLRPRG